MAVKLTACQLYFLFLLTFTQGDDVFTEIVGEMSYAGMKIKKFGYPDLFLVAFVIFLNSGGNRPSSRKSCTCGTGKTVVVGHYRFPLDNPLHS